MWGTWHIRRKGKKINTIQLYVRVRKRKQLAVTAFQSQAVNSLIDRNRHWDTHFPTIIWIWCWTSVRILDVMLLVSWSVELWKLSIVCWSWPIRGSRVSCSLCCLFFMWISSCWMSTRIKVHRKLVCDIFMCPTLTVLDWPTQRSRPEYYRGSRGHLLKSKEELWEAQRSF